MAGDERDVDDVGSTPDSADSNGPAPESPDRRRALKYGALAGLAGIVGLGAAIRILDDGGGGGDVPPATETERPPATPTETGGDDLLALVERFAPDLVFGRRERWYPTDPRPYADLSGDPRVVHGYDALLGYASEFREEGSPPNPAVFYHVVPLDDDVVALQYWMYSVFDQFAVNFHWHDWELLQVFVDAGTEEPVLLSASAHARSCPNNEFLRPDLGPGGRPSVLAEVGSHSSATDVNESRLSFERLPDASLASDVSNGFFRPLDSLVEQPFAYGLPRDEGARLPYSMPELEGVPLYEHDDLDGLREADFVDRDVTVRSWGDLARPPGDLPVREPGLVFGAPGSPTDGDVTYELFPLADASDAIDDFTGPQLSFEFAIPGFVEEQFASHITSAGIPWEDPRTTDPVGDVTHPAHPRTLVGEAPGGLTDRGVGAGRGRVGGAEGQVDAVDGDDLGAVEPFVSVSLLPLPVEVAVLLRSDPVATVTSGGVFRFLDVGAGTHELVVNGPGVAPYAEQFDHDGGTVRPGVDGRVAVVANEDAAVLRGDRSDSTGISHVRVVESFAGPVFDGGPVEDDRFAIPVHRDGDYTVTITDRDGVSGSVRVDPRELDGEPIPEVETGKAALSRSLGEFLVETSSLAAELGGGRATEGRRSIPAEFEVAGGEAFEAADVAAQGDAAGANELLVSVVDRLLAVRRLLREPGDFGYDEAAGSLLRYRAADGQERAEVAYATPLVG